MLSTSIQVFRLIARMTQNFKTDMTHEQKIIKEFINKVLHFGDENATYAALVKELWALPKEAGEVKDA